MTASFFALLLQLAVATPAEAGSTISLSAAVLGIAALGLLVTAKMLLDLRDRVGALESHAARSPQPRPAAKPTPPSSAAGAIAPEIVAVIAAAVHASLGGHYRIVAMQPMPETRFWSLEGRRQVFHSHQVR